MAPETVIASYNKAYNEARALYEDDQLDEAVEKAEQLLEEEGAVHSCTKEDSLADSC